MPCAGHDFQLLKCSGYTGIAPDSQKNSNSSAAPRGGAFVPTANTFSGVGGGGRDLHRNTHSASFRTFFLLPPSVCCALSKHMFLDLFYTCMQIYASPYTHIRLLVTPRRALLLLEEEKTTRLQITCHRMHTHTQTLQYPLPRAGQLLGGHLCKRTCTSINRRSAAPNPPPIPTPTPTLTLCIPPCCCLAHGSPRTRAMMLR